MTETTGPNVFTSSLGSCARLPWPSPMPLFCALQRFCSHLSEPWNSIAFLPFSVCVLFGGFHHLESTWTFCSIPVGVRTCHCQRACICVQGFVFSCLIFFVLFSPLAYSGASSAELWATSHLAHEVTNDEVPSLFTALFLFPYVHGNRL